MLGFVGRSRSNSFRPSKVQRGHLVVNFHGKVHGDGVEEVEQLQEDRPSGDILSSVLFLEPSFKVIVDLGR